MAVAPDLLLSSASEVRPKASPRPAAAPAEAAPGKSSSFAKVLADERQAEAANSRRAEARANAEKAQVDQQRQKRGADEPAAEPLIAEDGKPLPVAEEAEPVLDPMLLLGLGVQANTEEVVEDPAGGPGELAIAAAAALPVASGMLSDSEAGTEAVDGDAAELPGLGKNASSQAASASALATGGTAAADSEPGHTALDAEPEPEAGLELEAVPDKLAEQLPDADNDGGTDSNLDVRLNTLAQAVAQATPAQRALAAGQPLNMQHSGWSEAVVDRVMLLSSQNLKSAEIQLDPAELGRLDVRVSLTQDQTVVTFSSAHAGVREALESQAYRMREMFAQQGMGQVDVNVSDQSLARNFAGQRDDNEASGRSGRRAAHSGDERAVDDVDLPQAITRRGLVDYYA